MNRQIEIEQLKLILGTHTVLEDININIHKGDFISIVGPNGGGKSSLLKLMLGLLNPTEGKIRIEGQNPKDLDTHYFGYVPQLKTADRSFPALAIELVASGLKANWITRLTGELKDKSLDAMRQVSAEHLAFRPLNKLSGGEMQRIYLARSIARNPSILLLDEPATGIDISSENDLNEILNKIRNEKNTTVIMVTHDWESAYHHSDKVIILNKKVICFDRPEQAFTDEYLRIAFGHEGHKHKMIFGTGAG
jgi:zinc transport system ATP-binding protein